ncbi:MAG: hypothetical protein EZS26_001769 [Candidatus Ordinivivax streblomastigis]|uniref:DUF3298 domain-containing protein n=1 Tax=Candidatus Ordinivivax streblomastigis TaxID=2540710 RepID=A0A5M8P1A1_9BACT|nr:MAG: hypothetical protein EZS26_001769 [Candidatus Ordinivivax streblomastigis]
MKKINTLSFIIGSYLLLATACQPKIKTVDNGIVFDSISVNKTNYLGNDTTQLSCNLQISFVFPVEAKKQDVKTLQSRFIEKVLGRSLKDLTVEQAILNYTEQYYADFKLLEHDPIPVDEGQNSYQTAFDFASYKQLSNKLVYNGNDFVSFIVETTDYAGGAHPSSSVMAYVLNLKTGDWVQESQFAGDNYDSNISSILADKIAKANCVKMPEDLEELGYNSISEICPNNNFTLDNNGITYCFNEYDIAAYCVGITKVFIPYNELRVYIMPDSPIASLVNR